LDFLKYFYYFSQSTISINSFKDKQKGKEKVMDTQEEIDKAAEKIMRDMAISKLDACCWLKDYIQSSRKRLRKTYIFFNFWHMKWM
jgi:hypothetical protein